MNLDLGKIRIDGGTQPRAEINEAMVSEYAEAIAGGNVLPPADVFFDGRDYWLADGFHRYHGHRRAEKKAMPVLVHNGTKRDAVLFSVGANADHGLRRTNADKRRAVLVLLEDGEWGKWADNEIAQKCAVSQRFVSEVRSSLRTILSEDPNPQRTYTTKHGTTATMNTANIGRKPALKAEMFYDDPPPARKRASVKDQVGNALDTEPLREIWVRRQEMVDLMTTVSRVKSAVQRGLAKNDPLYQFISPALWKAACETLYAQLKFALPHAVCPAGHGGDPLSLRGCKWCGGQGWTNEEKYPLAMAAMRARK